MGRNVIKSLMGEANGTSRAGMESAEHGWGSFSSCSGLQIWSVAFSFSTDAWVNFKLFGSLGLTVLFVIAQAFYFSRHVLEDETS